MTHADLCSLAVKWLRRPESKAGPGCNVAVSECSAADNGEIPDAIGFRSVGMEQHSVLVEVKVSRADFLADARKPHRVDSAQGLGRFRYFLTPEGLIAANELPAGWGLIELVGRTLRVRAGHVLDIVGSSQRHQQNRIGRDCGNRSRSGRPSLRSRDA